MTQGDRANRPSAQKLETERTDLYVVRSST